jgi:hypothetical protein
LQIQKAEAELKKWRAELERLKVVKAQKRLERNARKDGLEIQRS